MLKRKKVFRRLLSQHLLQVDGADFIENCRKLRIILHKLSKYNLDFCVLFSVLSKGANN